MIEAAGLLCYRRTNGVVEVLLTHPGGPYWGKKDVWSIPKGELDEGEDHMAALRREFEEEVGSLPVFDADKLLDLGEAPQNSRKRNHIWAVEADFDLASFHCDSLATVEWPPKSGKQLSFPENDKAEWFTLGEARSKVFQYQAVFFDHLAAELGVALPEPTE